MTSNKREIQKVQAQSNIKESALEMFAKHGFAISVAKIAEQAGITKQALMYHYPTKQILLEAVIEDIEQSSLDSLLQFFSHLLKVKDTTETNKLEEIVGLFVEQNLWAVLFLRLVLEDQERYLPESFRQNHLLIITQLQEMQKNGAIQQNIDVAATFTNMNMLLLTTLATAQTKSTIVDSLGITTETWLKRRLISIFKMYRSTLFPH